MDKFKVVSIGGVIVLFPLAIAGMFSPICSIIWWPLAAIWFATCMWVA